MKHSEALTLRKYLKHKGSGPQVVELLKVRTRYQMQNPMSDWLSKYIFEDIEKVLPSLSGTLLDVGCYAGWLYHFTKDKVDYHGIDNWPEAISAAKELFPPERFTLCALADYTQKADIVWATQLHPEMERGMVMPHLVRLAKKRIFWTEQEKGNTVNDGCFMKVIEHGVLREGIIGPSLS